MGNCWSSWPTASGLRWKDTAVELGCSILHSTRIREMLADTALDVVSEFGKGCTVVFIAIPQDCNCWLMKVHFRFHKEILEWNGAWDLESLWSMICVKSVQDFFYILLPFTAMWWFWWEDIFVCCLSASFFAFKKTGRAEEKRRSLIGPIMKIMLKDRELK